MVDRLVDDHGWELELRVRGVFARWAELVGAEVAAHTTPESFVEGRLVVRTDSTAWATQLRLLAPTVVRRLNEELGHGTVTVIDVARAAPADLEEGAPIGARRPRSAGHLRLRILRRGPLTGADALGRSGGSAGRMGTFPTP